jgi:phosphate transport system ATP-binding protein
MAEYSFEDTYTLPVKEPLAMQTKNVSVYYGKQETPSLHQVSMDFAENKITALIGPSGSGKSTYLRCLNRMNDELGRIDGEILYRGINLNSPQVNVYETRREIGMVFQHPNPFAKSIAENITFAPKLYGIKDQQKLDQMVEESLKAWLSGMRSKIRLIAARFPFLVVSSSGFALPAHWPWILKSF